ncbi:MAG: hypothetical protein NW237_12870 [Cyanobacteriota bacterium]|nr:hypothetical protein [Cyanobacteriota bacterium]
MMRPMLGWRYLYLTLLTAGITVVGCGGLPAFETDATMFYRGSQTLTGSLVVGDPFNPADETYGDTIPIQASAGQILMVGMESSDVDPYLEVLNSQGEIIAFNDDAGPDVHAFLAVQLPEAGTYTIRATTFDPQATGDYQLSYSLGDVEWETQLTGSLTEGDAQHPDDQTWMDEYPISGKARQTLLVKLASAEFDAFVQVVNAQGDVIGQDDDQGGGSDALLAIYLEQSGDYTIRVNAYEDPALGSYTLSYQLR